MVRKYPPPLPSSPPFIPSNSPLNHCVCGLWKFGMGTERENCEGGTRSSRLFSPCIVSAASQKICLYCQFVFVFALLPVCSLVLAAFRHETIQAAAAGQAKAREGNSSVSWQQTPREGGDHSITLQPTNYPFITPSPRFGPEIVAILCVCVCFPFLGAPLANHPPPSPMAKPIVHHRLIYVPLCCCWSSI